MSERKEPSSADPVPKPGKNSSTTQEGTPLIRASDVTKHYGGIVAADGINLDIKENEILALVGDNGAGKSTFIKLLSGVISTTRGSFSIKNEDGDLEEVIIGSPSIARNAGIETVFQDRALSGQHDVAANVFMGREPAKKGIVGTLFRHIDREDMNQRTVEALSQIGFSIEPLATIEDLSGGQQQAVAVARALISDPDLVILDEPTAEVSVEGSRKILDLIRRLQSNQKTVVFVSHNMEEVLDVADRIAVLRQGNLVTILDNDGTVDRQDLVGYMTGALKPDEN